MNYTTLTLILGVVGSVLGVYQQIKTIRKQQEDAWKHQVEQQQRIETRLDALEKAVQSHNSYAEKFASLTETIIKMETDLSWIRESMK